MCGGQKIMNYNDRGGTRTHDSRIKSAVLYH